MFIDSLRARIRAILPDYFDLVDDSVTVSDRPDISDYQCNVALKLARLLKKAPIGIARDIQEALQKYTDIVVTVAAPGFVNITLHDVTIQEVLMRPDLFHVEAEKKRKIVLDYGGPNVAKPLHVGHLRSAVLGESVKRILRFVGHDVISDVHMGDWGTQMGKVLYGLQKMFPSLYDEQVPLIFTFDDLEESYTIASQAFKDSEEVAHTVRAITYDLQQGDKRYKRIWERVYDLSVENVRGLYKKLVVDFDLWYGESRYQGIMPSMCEDLERRGIAHVDDGALIAPLNEENEIPPVLLRKRDGSFLYATTDLATIKERVEEMGADTVVYVVDARQGLHFEQLFRLARKVGWDVDFAFLAFGTVNGSDGTPFKTRDGGAFKLADLLKDMQKAVECCMQEKGRDVDPHVVAAISLAALKIGDLQQDLRHNYVFSIEKFSQFEGKTGPYLLYVCTRIRSLLEKVSKDDMQLSDAFTSEERSLALLLMQYKEVILRAARNYAPHIICQYAFAIAAAYNTFYQTSPILQTKEVVRRHRVYLSHLTEQCLCSLCDLLGIMIPTYM